MDFNGLNILSFDRSSLNCMAKDVIRELFNQNFQGDDNFQHPCVAKFLEFLVKTQSSGTTLAWK